MAPTKIGRNNAERCLLNDYRSHEREQSGSLLWNHLLIKKEEKHVVFPAFYMNSILYVPWQKIIAMWTWLS